MRNPIVLRIAFLVLVVVQLYVPMHMMFSREAVLRHGKAYQFKTAPIDPSDPFRGRYITLSFEANQVAAPEGTTWVRGEVVYLTLAEDEAGFAYPLEAHKAPPADAENYLQANVRYVAEEADATTLTIAYPFDRFYLEETKAPAAEEAYRDAQQRGEQPAYALVHVQEGEAVLKDVMIDGVSIRTWAKQKNATQPLAP